MKNHLQTVAALLLILMIQIPFSGLLHASEEEETLPQPSTHYLMAATDGILAIEPDFSDAEFIPLPVNANEIEEPEDPKRHYIFQSITPGLFYVNVYKTRTDVWHYGDAGWLLEQRQQWTPYSISRHIDGTFLAHLGWMNGRIQHSERWTGEQVGQRLVWTKIWEEDIDVGIALLTGKGSCGSFSTRFR